MENITKARQVLAWAPEAALLSQAAHSRTLPLPRNVAWRTLPSSRSSLRAISIGLLHAPGTKLPQKVHGRCSPTSTALCHSLSKRSQSPKEVEVARPLLILGVQSSGTLHLSTALPCAHTSMLRAEGTAHVILSHTVSPQEGSSGTQLAPSPRGPYLWGSL